MVHIFFFFHIFFLRWWKYPKIYSGNCYPTLEYLYKCWLVHINGWIFENHWFVHFKLGRLYGYLNKAVIKRKKQHLPTNDRWSVWESIGRKWTGKSCSYFLICKGGIFRDLSLILDFEFMLKIVSTLKGLLELHVVSADLMFSPLLFSVTCGLYKAKMI